MCKDNYNKAIELIEQYNDIADFIGEQSEVIVNKAEQALGFIIPPMYRDFIKRYGAGNFGAEEIYGVTSDNFENSSVPDAIWFTITERSESNFPQHLLIIYDTGMGAWYCLDFSQATPNGEPPVVSFFSGFKTGQQNNNIVAKDFGEFLLSLVKEEIEN
ncbi:cell wall assembly protein [Bacillus solimangrovi]|uniref:Cell wall assembly protein n=2 Tax=Bacillus solimangrovi TaxID=1305675 RepID=A0A1E5LID2_9BACI|nr:cell wall assembly protein [Bacillus solimangrovi]